MEQINREHLSALVDGELSATELERATGHLTETGTLHAAWQRYHLIGDILRDDVNDGLHGLQVAARVREALASEPVVLAPRRRASTPWKPVAGFAIAATVAAIAVIGVQPGPVLDSGVPIADAPDAEVTTETAAPLRNTGVVSPLVAAADATDSTEADTGAVDAPANQRLNTYLVNFNEQRASMGMPGVHPHVRTVSFDTGR